MIGSSTISEIHLAKDGKAKMRNDEVEQFRQSMLESVKIREELDSEIPHPGLEYIRRGGTGASNEKLMRRLRPEHEKMAEDVEAYWKIVGLAKWRSAFGIEPELHEKHHIKPKSFGGSNDPKNLVVLELQEHLMAHVCLASVFPSKIDNLLIHAMAGRLKKRLKK